MSKKVQPLRPAEAAVAPQARGDLDSATTKKRQLAYARSAIVSQVKRLQQECGSPSAAIDRLAALFSAQMLAPSETRQILLAGKGKFPHRATIYGWLNSHAIAGVGGLVDQRTGRQRKPQAWDLRAVYLYQEPQRRCFAEVADKLREEGWPVKDHQVRRYLQSLPATVTTHNAKRLGKSTHRNTVRRPKARDVTMLKPGEAWVADGHRIKVMSQDPASGHLRRLEVTPILDIRSNYCLGAWWSFAESAENTVFAFCSVAARHGGLPVWFYSDVGPGFDNLTTAALFARSGTTHITAWPGMPSSKGFGEGFMKVLNNRFSKRFESYSGTDRTDDVMARFRTHVKRGQVTPPTDTDMIAEFERWREHFNRTPQPGSERLNGLSPAAFVEQAGGLTLAPLNMAPHELMRPHKLPTVRRGQVTLLGRTYCADFLPGLNGRRVRAYYDCYDESAIWLFDEKERYLGQATLIEKVPFVRENAAADARAKSERAAIARKQVQIARINEQYSQPISAASFVAELESPDQPSLPTPTSAQQCLEQGHSVTLPPVEIPSAPRPAPRPVHVEQIAQVERALAEEAEDADRQTPGERFAQALRLEQQGCANAEEARWLAIYQTSAEYHSRRALHDEFNSP